MQNVRAIQNYTGYSLTSRLIDMTSGLFRLIARWNERRHAARYLQTLSDQHLNDIGLRRLDILSAVYGEARPGPRGLDDF